MLKIFVKFLLFTLVLAMAGPFILRDPEGKPFMSLADLKLPHFDFSLSKPDAAPSTGGGGQSSQQWIQWSEKTAQQAFNPDTLTREQLAMLDLKEQDNIYYRWQDAKGIWQFSKLPNRNTLNYVVRTNPDANVLQSLAQEDIDRVFGRTPANSGNSITDNNPLANGKGLQNGMLPLPTTVPVTEIPKLIEQAKDVQKIMEARVKQMDQMAQ